MNKMKSLLQVYEGGQGLVEYALIVALVALVVIVGAGLLGGGIQRLYGVLAGAMGAHKDTVGVIEIQDARCIADKIQGKTGMVVTGYTTENLSDLSGSTNLSTTGMNGEVALFYANGTANSFLYHPLLANTADTSVCPISMVIQGKDNAIAVSPVTIETIEP